MRLHRHSPDLLFVIVCILFPFTALAGAWTQKENDWQVIATASLYEASHYFDSQGKKRRQTPYYKQELSGYTEYGMRDDITLGGQFTVARAWQASPINSDSNWNVGDSEFFLRKRLWQNDRSVISLQPSLLVPSPDGQSMPKVGSDHPAAGLRAAYGRNFTLLGRSHYADIELAYIHRWGAPSDQLKLEATAGLAISTRWQVIPQIFITHSTAKVKNSQFTQSPSDNYDLAKIQLSVQYAITPKHAVQLGAFRNAAGRNTGNGEGFLLGYVGAF